MRESQTRGRALYVTLMLAIVAAIVTAASAGASVPTAATVAPAAKTAPAPKARWARIVAAARREGTVTIYSSQNPIYLADFAKGFEQRYGIKGTVNRRIDSPLAQQLTPEHGPGRATADVNLTATQRHPLAA